MGSQTVRKKSVSTEAGQDMVSISRLMLFNEQLGWHRLAYTRITFAALHLDIWFLNILNGEPDCLWHSDTSSKKYRLNVSKYAFWIKRLSIIQNEIGELCQLLYHTLPCRQTIQMVKFHSLRMCAKSLQILGPSSHKIANKISREYRRFGESHVTRVLTNQKRTHHMLARGPQLKRVSAKCCVFTTKLRAQTFLCLIFWSSLSTVSACNLSRMVIFKIVDECESMYVKWNCWC